MTNTDTLSSLSRIIAQGLAVLSEGKRETGIKSTLSALFEERYHSRHAPKDGFRDAYGLANDDGVAWAGLIAEENPPSGAYGGASIAWFPREGGSLMTFVVGTRGLTPDEGMLTRHGHRRRVSALRRHLSNLGVTAWSKPDPAAINADMPDVARRLFPACTPVFKRYGSVIYCAAWVGSELDPAIARAVVQAFVDLYAFERNWEVRAARRDEFDAFLIPLRNAVFPVVTAATVNEILRARRFVVLQGPPGTGKTRLAETVRRDLFKGRGWTVQFHPAVTYEDFIVGLSPDPTNEGLRFAPRPGWLLEAAKEAAEEPYLLIIDEINRGDLGKVLGEAIYLFEPREVGGSSAREVYLTHSVEGKKTFRLPENLYVLATMNTADRSIAGLDLAVRRRFAFVTLMPDRAVVVDQAPQAAVGFFDRLGDVFIQNASDEMLDLLPGHSYYLAKDEADFKNRMRYDLLPLLDEYLRQGLLGAMASELHSVRDEIDDYANRV